MMEIIDSLNIHQFTETVVSLSDTAVIVYKIKDLYFYIKESLNKIWEDVMDMCDWCNKKFENLDKDIYLVFSKNFLAMKNYDVDIVSENLNSFYGDNAFEKFCKIIYVKAELLTN